MSADTSVSVTVRCIPDNRYALIGKNEKNVESTRRNPVNLVLVLDRSGSMDSHNKLEFAKKAVMSVLHLLHDDDIVHLVTYDNDAQNIFEDNRYWWQLSGGIESGADLLARYEHPGYSKRMFILSDGLAYVGLKTQQEIMKSVSTYNEKGIIIDSFGVGEDFDEKIMKAEVIVTLMTNAIQSVFDVCGTHTQLVIRGLNNATVTKIWGQQNATLGANLGDLHADNLRVILCDFTASSNVPDGTELDVLEYELKYNRPDDLEGEPITVSSKLPLIFVNDESLIRDIDPKVKALNAIQVAAEMDHRIAELINDRRRDEAIALIGEQINLLQEVQDLDDEKCMIAMLLRMVQNTQRRLREQEVSEKSAAKSYHHQAHMKKCHDHKYTNYYADED
ncbi:unnamed protein product [Rotaria magnacalcarata]|uniref:VWFA domain-containing protein n=1 Tax=Rotaria magnacalcarata TaxID=392030 RepID=A0A819YCX7_9BILA|nr:unnamed protein product [Rotaria magnacalcarata]